MENQDIKNLDSSTSTDDKDTNTRHKQNRIFWWAFGIVSVICAVLLISALVIKNDSKTRSAQMILIKDATSDLARTGLLQKIKEQALTQTSTPPPPPTFSYQNLIH